MSPWRHGQYSTSGREYQPRSPRWKRPQSAKIWPAPKLGSHICSFLEEDFASSAKNHANMATITECEPVSSYNWVDSTEPDIMVPGKPPKWTPLKGHQTLTPDRGEYYRDPNAMRFPTHPLEPAVLSVLEASPVAAEDVDIFACSSTLGNLLRFVRRGDARDNKPFRFLVQTIGDAVFFVRRENDPKETIPDVKGWGHTFPEAYTTWEQEVKGSTSNQRVIKYRFGGLNLLVRSKCDGYLPATGTEKDGKATASSAPKNNSKGKANDLGTDDMDNLLDSFSNARVGAATPAGVADGSDAAVTVKHAGSLVPQSQIFDLKTRSVRRQDQDVLAQEIQRFWIAQIPNFVLAYHESGVFMDKNISVRQVGAEIQSWEKENNLVLSKLAAVVHKLVDMVRARADGKMEVCHVVGSGEESILEIREQLEDAGEVLSVGAKARFLAARVGDDDDDDDFSYQDFEDDENGRVWARSSDDYELGGDDDGDDSDPDFTACDKECGYCGKCPY